MTDYIDASGKKSENDKTQKGYEPTSKTSHMLGSIYHRLLMIDSYNIKTTWTREDTVRDLVEITDIINLDDDEANQDRIDRLYPDYGWGYPRKNNGYVGEE